MAKGLPGLGLLAAAAIAAGCAPDPAPSAPAAAAPATASAVDRQAAFDRAWERLEVDGKPAEAAPALLAIADDPAAPAPLRGRALLLLARCERRLGRGEEAERLLRRALEGAAPGSLLRGEIQAESAIAAGERSRWITGTLEVRPGQFLDLDAGGLFDAPATPDGGRAEVHFSAADARIAFLVPDAGDRAGMEAAMPWIADAPWRALTTDLGRPAWVQVLPSAPAGAVRFVTRLSGSGAILAPPRDPCCLGRGNAIEVRFAADPAYASYRVERRAGPDAPFAEAAIVAAPPWTDASAVPGVRWGYRITGIAPSGDEGIPAVVQGTTASAGLVSGSLSLEPGSSRFRLDLLRGEVVQEGGDFLLDGLVHGRDGRGRAALRRPLRDPARSPWEAPAGERPPDSGDACAFLVPLLGGGVARVRVLPVEDRRVRVDWEAWPDGDALPPAPNLEASAVDGGVRLSLSALPRGWTCRAAVATPLLPDGPAREVALVDGAGSDLWGAADRGVRYEVRAIDPHGRAGPAGAAEVFRPPEGIVRGGFRFHYRQGFSFDREAVVPAEEADLVFETCAGGISSITLAAPSGIINLRGVVPHGVSRAIDARTIFDALFRADPGALRLRPKAQGDDREPASDVFLLRTRSGGWAKVVILGRGTGRGWTENLAYCSFVYSPREAVFDAGAAADAGVGGILLGPLDPAAAADRARARDAAILGDAADSQAARALLARLREERLRVRLHGRSLDRFAEVLKESLFPVEFGAGVDPSREVDVEADTGTAESLLDRAALSLGVRWRITAAGAVRFERKESKGTGR